MNQSGDIAVIGLAVMGQNLILNMSDHGYTVVAFNRTLSKVDDFLNNEARGRATIIGAHSLPEMLSRLKRPRKIMLMVKAGSVVDDFIDTLMPLLDMGDVVIDGGNSLYLDTIRRSKALAEKGILYLGTGVSGGEEGARHGPSIMPGGNPQAWPLVKDLFQAISAKTDEGEPCCDWVGEDGAGHFVKMTHNGIEYGDMQLICEVYHLMKSGLGLGQQALHEIFTQWNRGDLNSYLIEITADIMAFRDDDGTPLLDKIVDRAGQKGTGKWTGISSLELGVPVTLIVEAVYSRSLSALKDERVAASRLIQGPAAKFDGDIPAFVEDIRKALLAAKIVSYAQGYMLMREAAREYGWKLNYGGIALMWRGGCIIRSAFLEKIKAAFDTNPELNNLLVDDYFRAVIADCQPSWRRVAAKAIELGISMPALTTALAFFDGYRCGRLPANLLQAQRDYFGAHTYERLDKPAGVFFHSNWTGRGGSVSSSSYQA
jgi:6-phosphogluconate dehydrogenase